MGTLPRCSGYFLPWCKSLPKNARLEFTTRDSDVIRLDDALKGIRREIEKEWTVFKTAITAADDAQASNPFAR